MLLQTADHENWNFVQSGSSPLTPAQSCCCTYDLQLSAIKYAASHLHKNMAWALTIDILIDYKAHQKLEMTDDTYAYTNHHLTFILLAMVQK